jgi:hypothetical protein
MAAKLAQEVGEHPPRFVGVVQLKVGLDLRGGRIAAAR